MRVAITFRSGLQQTYENAYSTVSEDEVWISDRDSDAIIDTYQVSEIQSILMDFGDESDDPVKEGH